MSFFGPVRFRGHFEEIAIAKILLNRLLSNVVWESFGDVDFPTSEKVWREKNSRRPIARAGDHNKATDTHSGTSAHHDYIAVSPTPHDADEICGEHAPAAGADVY